MASTGTNTENHRGLLPSDDVVVIAFGGSASNVDKIIGEEDQAPPLADFLFNQANIGTLGKSVDYVDSLEQRDSLDVDKQLLKELRDVVLQSPARTIVVTTGLNRIVEISQFLKRNLPTDLQGSKQILVTGSYEQFKKSDGDGRFNIANAYGHKFGTEGSGVSIVLNAGKFDPDEIYIDLNSKTVFYVDLSIDGKMSPINPTQAIITFGGTSAGAEATEGKRFAHGFISPYLGEVIRPRRDPNHILLTTEDSRDITPEDLDRLAATIIDLPQQEILFSVGTVKAQEILDKLASREDLQKVVNEQGKKVIGVAALTHPSLPGSDAAASYGISMSAAQHIPPGLYLCVQGELVKQGHFRKNTQTRRFELLDLTQENI